jgi:phosphopantothenoylcysteine synthetase/decarboxylase
MNSISEATTFRQRRPRVLLGITGSVAAVKGPELALRLARDSRMDVRILLTRGGQNFWDKAVDYNKNIWDDLERIIQSSKTIIEQGNEDDARNEGTIRIHGR